MVGPTTGGLAPKEKAPTLKGGGCSLLSRRKKGWMPIKKQEEKEGSAEQGRIWPVALPKKNLGKVVRKGVGKVHYPKGKGKREGKSPK